MTQLKKKKIESKVTDSCFPGMPQEWRILFLCESTLLESKADSAQTTKGLLSWLSENTRYNLSDFILHVAFYTSLASKHKLLLVSLIKYSEIKGSPVTLTVSRHARAESK